MQYYGNSSGEGHYHNLTWNNKSEAKEITELKAPS